MADEIEAKVISASFGATVRGIVDSGDAERALQFLERMRKLIDAGFKFELRADVSRQREIHPQTTTPRPDQGRGIR